MTDTMTTLPGMPPDTDPQRRFEAVKDGVQAALYDFAGGVYRPQDNPYLSLGHDHRQHRGCDHATAEFWADGYVGAWLASEAKP